jgi:hypothetical protein
VVGGARLVKMIVLRQVLPSPGGAGKKDERHFDVMIEMRGVMSCPF